MSEEQHQDIGSPDRICVEWDGINLPKIIPFELKIMKECGFQLMSEDELKELGYNSREIDFYGSKTDVLTDGTGDNFFVNLPGKKKPKIFRKLSIEDINPNHINQKDQTE